MSTALTRRRTAKPNSSRLVGVMSDLKAEESAIRTPFAAPPAELLARVGERWLNLTPRMQEMVRLVWEYQQEHGYSPTMQELADEMGVSKVTIFEYAKACTDRGVIFRKPNIARGLVIVDSRDGESESALREAVKRTMQLIDQCRYVEAKEKLYKALKQ